MIIYLENDDLYNFECFYNRLFSKLVLIKECDKMKLVLIVSIYLINP